MARPWSSLCATLTCLVITACGPRSTAPSSDGADPPTAASCDAHATRVQALYDDALPAAGDGDDAAALRTAEIADNTHMVLADCRTQPARFAPCLARARTVAELEAHCVVPLDDAGEVEGAYFRERARN